MNVGDIVRFTEDIDPGDTLFRFILIEDNGDRVIIQLIDDHWTMKPTRCVRRVEICKA